MSIECPVCVGHRFKSLFEVQEADVVACKDCGTVYVPSPLPEVTSLYKANYFISDDSAHGYSNYDAELEAHETMFTERLKNSEIKLGGKAKVLDVGCALGHFGKVAADRGWDVFITDISEFAVQKASTDFNLKGFVSPAGKLPVKKHKFELVTLFDVVEHLSHPLEMLEQIHQAMDQKGVLHLTTPNVKSLSARLMRKHWYHYKPDEHLVYFSPQTITMALERTGFEVLEIRPMPVYMAIGDIFMRMRRYSKPIFDFCHKMAKLFKIDRKVIRLFTGEMEVWARPKSESNTRRAFPLDIEPTPILGVVHCPNCEGELYPESSELICLSCDSSFDIEFGVINFSKYGKRSRKTSTGS